MFDTLRMKLKLKLNILVIVVPTLFFLTFFFLYYHMIFGDYRNRMEMSGKRTVENIKINIQSMEEKMSMFMYQYDMSKIETEIPDELDSNFFYSFVIYCPCDTVIVTMKNSEFFLPEVERGKYGNFINDYRIDEVLSNKNSCWTYYASPDSENDMVFLTKPIKDENGNTVGYISAGMKSLDFLVDQGKEKEIFGTSVYAGFDNGKIISPDGKAVKEKLLKKVLTDKKSYSDINVSITYGDLGEKGFSVLLYSDNSYIKKLLLQLAGVLIIIYTVLLILYMMFIKKIINWIINQLIVLHDDIDTYSENLRIRNL